MSRILPLFLTRISRDITESNLELSNAELGWLWRWSKVYSINERLYELTGKKEKQEVFDTSELDAALLRGDRIDVFGDTYVRFSGDKISGGKDKAISVVTSDESIIKRSVKESIIEESAQTLKELPKFKNVMKERRKNE
jgi:hypothetical protein